MDVVGRRLPAHEDDGLARPPELLGAVRGEDDLPARCARGGVEAGGHDLDLGLRVDHRVQELVELRGVDPRHGLLARDQILADHVDRGPERRRGGALRRSRLEQVEPVVLDRELEVLDVPVVLLEPPRRVDEPVVRVREPFAHAGERLWCADARDDVLALRVEQELAEDPGLAGGRVARERDAGARALALVAEHHLDDVHRRAEVVGDLVCAPVHLGARRVPGGEDRLDRAAELLARLLRERLPEVVLVDHLERVDELAEVVGAKVDVVRDAALLLQLLQLALEPVRIDPVDGLAVHLDQAAIGVVCEPRVAGGAGQAFDGHVRETDVQDRVHHPRHRDRRPRADGDEQRLAWVAEALADALLEPLDVDEHLVEQPVRERAAARHRVAARLGRDREPGRHGQAELRHLGEPDPLPAQQRPPSGRGLVEVVDVPHGDCSFTQAPGILVSVPTRFCPVNVRRRGRFDFVRRQRLLLP